jgi:hypothetical protein
MQLIGSPSAPRPPIGAIVAGTIVGSILVVGGLFLGWVAYATPVLTGLSSQGVRTSALQMAIGAVVWGFALVGPASFAIVGALRIGQVARAITAKPPVRVLTRAAPLIDDSCVAATDVRLPDGRVIRNLVIGPFGMVVISELPAAALLRHHGLAWEVRGPNGRWHHIENPLERAARDAERVKSWITSAERDFLVKVYAAVVTDDPTIERTPQCAVVGPTELPAWLGSLPPSRAITPDRRTDLIEAVRALL